MPFTIRRSRKDEGDKLISIWCRSVDATHHFLSADYRIELEELVSSFLPEAPLWLSLIHISDPDVRGSGVGKLLIEHALSMVSTLTTNVNEQNEQAVGFYKKMGFTVTGRTEVDALGRAYPLLNLVHG